MKLIEDSYDALNGLLMPALREQGRRPVSRALRYRQRRCTIQLGDNVPLA
jgi:hypothetical protein